MRGRFLLRAIAAATCVPACLSCNHEAKALSLHDLEGFSIEVDYTANTIFIRDGATRSWTDRRGLHLYIGKGGHIFSYGGFGKFWGKSVSSLNKARTYLPGQMAAFTFVDGNLTQISKLRDGFGVQTIAVNSSRDACTFSDVYKPGQDGKLMGFDPMTQAPFELVSRTVQFYTCTVRQGNIFEGDAASAIPDGASPH